MQFLKTMGQPAVESFDFMLDGALRKAVSDIAPVEFLLPSGDKVRIKLNGVDVRNPCLPEGAVCPGDKLVYPKVSAALKR